MPPKETGGMSKDEMLEAVEEIDYDEIHAAMKENGLRARELVKTHIGKVVEFTDYVESVGNNAAIIGGLL